MKTILNWHEDAFKLTRAKCETEKLMLSVRTMYRVREAPNAKMRGIQKSRFSAGPTPQTRSEQILKQTNLTFFPKYRTFDQNFKMTLN